MLSPKAYPLSETEEGYEFVTEHGTKYTVYFIDGSDYLPSAPFSNSIRMFGFECEGQARQSSDERIRATLITTLQKSFLAEPELILVYVCSQERNLHRGRSLLFQAWYREFGSGYSKIDHSEGDSFYASAIFKANHPGRKQIETSIQQFIEDFQSK